MIGTTSKNNKEHVSSMALESWLCLVSSSSCWVNGNSWSTLDVISMTSHKCIVHFEVAWCEFRHEGSIGP